MRSKSFPLKILSYNIHQGITVRRHRLSLSILKQAISSLDPDVIVLQEVAGHTFKESVSEKSKGISYQLEALADKLWPHSAFGKNAAYSGKFHGNAILSKYPIVDWKKVDISVGKLSRRSLLHVTVLNPVTQKNFHIIGVHLGLLQYERRMQIEAVCQYANHEVGKEETLFLAGDFNDWRKQVSSPINALLTMTEVFKENNDGYAKTFPSKLPLLTLDRIYFRGGTLKEVVSPKGKPWTSLSDHLPILARFVIP